MSSNNQRILKISSNKIYVSPNNYFHLSMTNFPEGSISFRYYEDIYWKIEINEFNPHAKSLKIKVLDYNPSDTSAFNKQELRKNINKLVFYDLNWHQLQPQLTSYKEIALLDLLSEEDVKKFSETFRSEINIETEPIKQKKPVYLLKKDFESEDKLNDIESYEPPQPIKIQREFNYYFKAAEFNDGYVLIRKKFDFYDSKIEFQIFNDNLKKEYDYVKHYFPKVLDKKKTFQVSISLVILNDEIIEKTARSPEIEKIDNSTIVLIETYQAKRITKISDSTESRSIYTVEEIAEKIQDLGEIGKNYILNESNILSRILDVKKIRNRKQLEYLSGRKHNPDAKLRFTLSPIFGFLFTIQGEKHSHFCWELLDSHATYVWSIDNNAHEKKISRIEETINIIKEIGRKQYRKEYIDF